MGSTNWHGFYESLPDGRSKITAAALIAITIKDGLRVLDSLLEGVASRILLLDIPLKVGEAVNGSEIPEYYLRRIPIKDLPGWPPIFEVTGREAIFPSLLQCRMVKATFRKGRVKSGDGLEIDLELNGQSFRAWYSGCPAALLKCVEATLNQAGVAGLALRDVQDVRLIGAG